eukprot:m.124738 g.124738  ORF g.124738 m.124738 type:complete len:809 (+) comp15718_c2_seq2:553-2979(+)
MPKGRSTRASTRAAPKLRFSKDKPRSSARLRNQPFKELSNEPLSSMDDLADDVDDIEEPAAKRSTPVGLIPSNPEPSKPPSPTFNASRRRRGGRRKSKAKPADTLAVFTDAPPAVVPPELPDSNVSESLLPTPATTITTAFSPVKQPVNQTVLPSSTPSQETLFPANPPPSNDLGLTQSTQDDSIVYHNVSSRLSQSPTGQSQLETEDKQLAQPTGSTSEGPVAIQPPEAPAGYAKVCPPLATTTPKPDFSEKRQTHPSTTQDFESVHSQDTGVGDDVCLQPDSTQSQSLLPVTPQPVPRATQPSPSSTPLLFGPNSGVRPLPINDSELDTSPRETQGNYPLPFASRRSSFEPTTGLGTEGWGDGKHTATVTGTATLLLDSAHKSGLTTGTTTAPVQPIKPSKLYKQCLDTTTNDSPSAAGSPTLLLAPAIPSDHPTNSETSEDSSEPIEPDVSDRTARPRQRQSALVTTSTDFGPLPFQAEGVSTGLFPDACLKRVWIVDNCLCLWLDKALALCAWRQNAWSVVRLLPLEDPDIDSIQVSKSYNVLYHTREGVWQLVDNASDTRILPLNKELHSALWVDHTAIAAVQTDPESLSWSLDIYNRDGARITTHRTPTKMGTQTLFVVDGPIGTQLCVVGDPVSLVLIQIASSDYALTDSLKLPIEHVATHLKPGTDLGDWRLSDVQMVGRHLHLLLRCEDVTLELETGETTETGPAVLVLAISIADVELDNCWLLSSQADNSDIVSCGFGQAGAVWTLSQSGSVMVYTIQDQETQGQQVQGFSDVPKGLTTCSEGVVVYSDHALSIIATK